MASPLLKQSKGEAGDVVSSPSFAQAPVSYVLSKVPYKYEFVLFIVAAITRYGCGKGGGGV